VGVDGDASPQLWSSVRSGAGWDVSGCVDFVSKYQESKLVLVWV